MWTLAIAKKHFSAWSDLHGGRRRQRCNREAAAREVRSLLKEKLEELNTLSTTSSRPEVGGATAREEDRSVEAKPQDATREDEHQQSRSPTSAKTIAMKNEQGLAALDADAPDHRMHGCREVMQYMLQVGKRTRMERESQMPRGYDICAFALTVLTVFEVSSAASGDLEATTTSAPRSTSGVTASASGENNAPQLCSKKIGEIHGALARCAVVLGGTNGATVSKDSAALRERQETLAEFHKLRAHAIEHFLLRLPDHVLFTLIFEFYAQGHGGYNWQRFQFGGPPQMLETIAAFSRRRYLGTVMPRRLSTIVCAYPKFTLTNTSVLSTLAKRLPHLFVPGCLHATSAASLEREQAIRGSSWSIQRCNLALEDAQRRRDKSHTRLVKDRTLCNDVSASTNVENTLPHDDKNGSSSDQGQALSTSTAARATGQLALAPAVDALPVATKPSRRRGDTRNSRDASHLLDDVDYYCGTYVAFLCGGLLFRSSATEDGRTPQELVDESNGEGRGSAIRRSSSSSCDPAGGRSRRRDRILEHVYNQTISGLLAPSSGAERKSGNEISECDQSKLSKDQSSQLYLGDLCRLLRFLQPQQTDGDDAETADGGHGGDPFFFGLDKNDTEEQHQDNIRLSPGGGGAASVCSLLAPHPLATRVYSPLVEFIPIPETLSGLLAYAWEQKCLFGQKKPMEPAICLLTGRVIGMAQECKSFPHSYFGLNIASSRRSNGGQIGEATALSGPVGAGHGIYLLPYNASVLVVTTDGLCFVWDFAFPYVDTNGENVNKGAGGAHNLKRILEMRLDRRKLDALRQIYTFGGMHKEIIRVQNRTMRYYANAL
ncbi:unnamed protein product [Amoebophrya sp. A25]|nr:unnamed protein product [Amoebophrya sp. A25]|eukprot:GSA25T00007688001.1